ncbi:hypothetical protein KUCAC02_008515 [Chaenocephalus aceratus]|uniref:Uncharacterized protein n=1 Tax=Chaenocephalus aceratus TaxID=36190 RepID=A0ACB9XAC6_CHAAC|nr:hypothetical protein KUCAC02_008515 [Chaenocephalus aceratus]
MASRVSLHSQLTSIMETLAMSALKQVCKLVDEDYAELHVGLSQLLAANSALEEKVNSLECELATMRSEAPVLCKSNRSVGVQTVCHKDGDAQVSGSPIIERIFGKDWCMNLWKDTDPCSLGGDSPKCCNMHITIREGRSLPDLQRCTTCCKDFHCPLCASNVFHPAKLSKVQAHLESHFNRAVLHEGYTIHRCALNCRPQCHFHCFYCQSTLMRKPDFIKHLALCKAKHTAITAIIPDPATAIIPDPATPIIPDPATAIIPDPATAIIPDPATAIIPDPVTPIIPDPATAIIPDPDPAIIPDPATSIIPDPATPIIPEGKIKRVHVVPVLKKKCPICHVLINKNLFKKHMERKHSAKQKDITACSHLQSECIDPENRVDAVHKAFHGTTCGDTIQPD